MSDASKRMKELQKGLMTKEEALQKIDVFENCEERVISGKTGFVMHPSQDGQFVLQNQGNEFAVNEAAFMKLCRLCGITETYARKIPDSYLFPHLKYWLGEGGKAVKAFTKVTDKEGRPSVAGFAKEDAYYYPVSRVLEQADKVSAEYQLEGLEDISWRNTTFGLVYPEFEFEIPDKVEEGDWVYGGIKVRTSLLGEFPTKISAFIMTLACLNGMVSANEVYKFNRKQGFDGQDVWVTDSVQMALGALTQEVERVQALKEAVVDSAHMTAYVNHVFDQMGVNQKSRLAVLEQMMIKQPETLYDLMNVVTSVAHTIENRSEVYQLQAVGGYVVQHVESCATCHRPF